MEGNSSLEGHLACQPKMSYSQERRNSEQMMEKMQMCYWVRKMIDPQNHISELKCIVFKIIPPKRRNTFCQACPWCNPLYVCSVSLPLSVCQEGCQTLSRSLTVCRDPSASAGNVLILHFSVFSGYSLALWGEASFNLKNWNYRNYFWDCLYTHSAKEQQRL